MEDVPLDSVVLVEGEAYVARLPVDGGECAWVLHPNKVGVVAQTKLRMMGAMLLDEGRNSKYRAAIQQTCRAGQVVLDAGCGTGLLSLLAAQAGASTVWASEMNEVFCELAQRVVDANPEFEPAIECISKRTTDFALEDGDRADVILTETMDSILTTEGMIGTICDAKRRLGKPQAVCIPERARVWGRLVRLTGALRDVHESRQHADRPLLIHADCARVAADMHAVSSTDLVLLQLSFEEQGHVTAQVEFDGSGEQAHALLMWWECDLAPGITLSTNPFSGEPWQDHWHHGLYMLDLAPGESKVELVLNAETGCIVVHGAHTSPTKRPRTSPPTPYEHTIWKDIPAGAALVEGSHTGLHEIDLALMHLYSAVPSVLSAQVLCCSASFEHLRNPKLHLSQVCGFDHRPIIEAWNSVPDALFGLSLYNYDFTLTSHALRVAKMDMSSGELTLSQANAKLDRTLPRANALLFWLEWTVDNQRVFASTADPSRVHPLATTQVLFLDRELDDLLAQVFVSAALDGLTNRLHFHAKIEL